MAPLVLLIIDALLMLHLLNATITPVADACSPSDLQALRSFSKSVLFFSKSDDDYYDGDNARDTWRGLHCCSWEGVTCSKHHLQQRVSELALFNVQLAATLLSSRSGGDPGEEVRNQLLEPFCNLSLLSSLHLTYNTSLVSSLSLPIPDCLGNVSTLHTISLSNTNLRGSIPSSFAHLLRLQHLDLSFNPLLSGPLLPLAHLPSLTSLSLSSCSFSAPLPPLHTPLLESLDLAHNHFTSSSLLSFVLQSQLPSLTLLSFSSCSLSGSLPVFNSLPILTHLDLSHNSFTSLQDFTLYSHLPALSHLNLFHNSISGPIPPSIARLSSLIVLDLRLNKIEGVLSESLCNLTLLKHLKLSQNALVSEDMSLNRDCRFIHLTQLDLSSNLFQSPFPSWVGRSPLLTDLNLSSNHFQGPLPNEWQDLRSLETLDLSGNKQPFDSSAPRMLRQWIFRLPRLAHLFLDAIGLQTEDLWCRDRLSMLNQTLITLSLSGNNLTGADTLQCFAAHNFTTNLLYIKLSQNPLFINLSDVQLGPLVFTLDLTSCGLEGHLPGRFVQSLQTAYRITLSQNRLSGSFPAEICNLQAPHFLNFSYNFFTGVDACANGTFFGYRTTIDLSHNALAGDLTSLLLRMGLPPSNYCLQGSSYFAVPWQDIDLSHNELVGRIPSSLGLCGSYLNRIKLNSNRLIGGIPGELGIPKYLAILTLNNNYLSRNIPLSIVSLSTLILLDLSYNQLEGDLKMLFSFSNTTSLRVLLLSHNQISGSFPPFFGVALPWLQLIDLSHNNITGTIPQDLRLPAFEILTEGSVINGSDTLFEVVPIVAKGVELQYSYVVNVLTSLDLSGNHLVGAIPPQLGNLSGLLFLNLSHNSLSGSIPAALANLSQLESLDLSFNRLQGHIPSDLSRLTGLADFDVSFNEALTGIVPTGPQFERSQSYEGDVQLCGFPVLPACKEVVTAEAPLPEGPETEGRSAAAEWINEWVSVPGLCLGLVVGMGGTLWLLHGSPLNWRLHPR